MVLKRVLAGTVCTTLLLWCDASLADHYRPDEFLGMDFSKAALSPKPLGPPQSFVPVSPAASADRDSATGHFRPEPVAASKITKTTPTLASSRISPDAGEHPRGAARTRLARRHRNPLDAEALDTRIQVWPCKSSGGICGWKR
jgi:hypothetical protein